MPAFDTLQFAKDLETSFTPEQAETLARALARHVTENLATKADLDLLETRLRTEFKTGLSDLKADLIRWIVGAIVFNLAGTAGLVITLIKTIPR